MAVKAATTSVVVPELRIRTMEVAVLGASPLIVHAWSQKAKLEMLGKQMKVAKGAKEAKDPWQDFQDSLYRLPGGGYGFPSVAFKAAAVTACTSVADMTKIAARQAFHIVGEQISIPSAYEHNGRRMEARYDLVRIIAGEPEMREDMVRVGMGTADLRYRGQFWPWAARLNVSYNEGVLSEGQIMNLINTAGFGVGIGEWRAERDGTYGRFHAASAAEMSIVADIEQESRLADAA
jgi:hypothetical protein